MLNCYDVLPKVLLEIGPLQVRFYGTMIALSTILGYFLMTKIIKKIPDRFSKKIDNEDIFDAIFWSLIGGIIGARLFYVLFYNFDFYSANPSQILAIYNGGLSVHGGVFGGALGLFSFARKNKFSFWEFADLLVPFLALGLAFGRIANFVNGELIGRETDWRFGCDFGGEYDGENRWPVQIFDSIKNFIIFAVTLTVLLKTKTPKGFTSGLFLTLIGSLRFITEFFREPDSQLGFIFAQVTAGQIFGVITLLTGVCLIYLSYRKSLKTLG